MDRRRAAQPPASQSCGWRADDDSELGGSQSCGWRADDDSELGDEELGVFTAERYFNDALTGEDASWCDRSSSSFSSAFKTWQHDEPAVPPTAATSSSEASWNSRSALLVCLPASAAAPAIEAKPNSTTESEPTGGKARPSSSHLWRWILGMAGCAFVCGDIEESLDMFHQAGQGTTLVSATQSSAYTIVAGSRAQGGAAGGSKSPNRSHRRVDSVVDDAGATSEVEYMYPPSEASIVWSVVTAEGAASGNFSSAASGCYYYFNDEGDEEAMRHMAAGGKSNRRGRHNGGSLLMGCMSKRAVAVGRPRTWSEVEPAPVARMSGPDMTRRR